MCQKKSEEENRPINLEKEAQEKQEKIDEKISTTVHQTEFKKDSEKEGDIINARILKLEAELADALKRENENLLRHKAEEQNIRRNNEREIEKTREFALQKFAFQLLPVIDNLERSLEAFDQSGAKPNAMTEGVQLTLKSLLETVNKFGIAAVECQCNVPLNPDIHQAVGMVESDEHEPNHVVSIISKGYTLNGRLLRPAMVNVSKKKS